MATITARRGWSRPQAHEVGWDDDIQGIIDDLDAAAGFLDAASTWTAEQTLLGGVLGNGFQFEVGGTCRFGDVVSPEGTLSVAGKTVYPAVSVVVADGANHNVAINPVTLIELSGPTAAFSITGMTSGEDDRFLILQQDTGQTLTLVHESSASTATNRITTNTGADVAVASGGRAMFLYSGSRWVLIGVRPEATLVASGANLGGGTYPASTTLNIQAAGATDVPLRAADSSNRPLLTVGSVGGVVTVGESTGAREAVLRVFPATTQTANPVVETYDATGSLRDTILASGAVTLTTATPAQVSGDGTDADDPLTVTGGNGGNTTGVSGQTGGRGADIALTAGAGGDAPSGSTNGSGGTITLTPGAAGAGAGTAGIQGALNLSNTAGQINLDGRVILTQQLQTLTADNTAITPPRGTLFLDSDSTTATDRTFTLEAGDAGQILILVWTHDTNRGELVKTGNAKLTATWSPDRYDTLMLVSDGTNWLEIGRAANA